MNIKNSKKLVFAVAFLMMVVSFTSCNRGYGCPYELKTAVKTIAPLVIK